jgi:hypothetical protein
MKKLIIIAALTLQTASAAHAQWSQVHEQFYLAADHNWEFRKRYAVADRLFNAFDYGHAILYEILYSKPNAPVSRLEEVEYNFITRKVLPKPPRVPLEEGAIEIAYAKIAPEAKAMFEWAHVLHRQIYDVLAAEDLSQSAKDEEIATLIRYYKTRPEIAFSSRAKNMELMEGQYYATEFRNRYPKFNGLIWAYHWLQVGLYEPLMVGDDFDARQTGVTATVARFRQMIEDPPTHMPRVMPMTAAIAPTFTARYPEAAIIFDNLHAMHDVISDILVSSKVSRDRKRAEIVLAAQRYRDDTSFVMNDEEWRQMAQHMGQHNMGGPAVGFLPGFPTPTLARGAVMAGMAMGNMPGMQHAQHQAAPRDTGAMAQMDHARMPGMQADSARAMAMMDMQRMMQMHERMMADPVIRERVASDPVLRQMMQGVEMKTDTSGQHAGHAANAAAADSTEAREVMEFITLLLSNPQIEARVHADPRLHRLWSDPGVQRCLTTLRRLKKSGQPLPTSCPAR